MKYFLPPPPKKNRVQKGEKPFYLTFMKGKWVLTLYSMYSLVKHDNGDCMVNIHVRPIPNVYIKSPEYIQSVKGFAIKIVFAFMKTVISFVNLYSGGGAANCWKPLASCQH